jgi:hypothetical protein
MDTAFLEMNLRLVGSILVGVAILHFGLPKKFEWATDLPKLTGFNRHMFVVQCFFVAFNSFLMGCICLFVPGCLLVRSQAGLVLSLWLTIYWAARLWCQFFVYPKELWVGKKFETCMHILFSCIWIYVVVCFANALMLQNSN